MGGFQGPRHTGCGVPRPPASSPCLPHLHLLLPQGLTGPIGPPGPAGANGEKVSRGFLSSLPHLPHPASSSLPDKVIIPVVPPPGSRIVTPPTHTHWGLQGEAKSLTVCPVRGAAGGGGEGAGVDWGSKGKAGPWGARSSHLLSGLPERTLFSEAHAPHPIHGSCLPSPP